MMDLNSNHDSRKKTIRIPSIEIQFDKTKYESDVLGRHISKEAFEETINLLNKFAIEAFFKARRHKGAIYPSTLRILASTVVLNIIFFIIGSFDSISIVFSVVFIIGINSFIIILIVMIYLTPITQLSKADLYIKEVIEKKLIEINGQYTNQLKWRYDAFDKAILITAV